MSIEIAGLEHTDRRIAGEAGIRAAAFLIEEGVRPDEAHLLTTRNGAHAVGLTLTVLRKMNLLEGDIDLGEFIAFLDEIEDETLPDGRVRARTHEANDNLRTRGV